MFESPILDAGLGSVPIDVGGALRRWRQIIDASAKVNLSPPYLLRYRRYVGHFLLITVLVTLGIVCLLPGAPCRVSFPLYFLSVHLVHTQTSSHVAPPVSAWLISAFSGFLTSVRSWFVKSCSCLALPSFCGNFHPPLNISRSCLVLPVIFRQLTHSPCIFARCLSSWSTTYPQYFLFFSRAPNAFAVPTTPMALFLLYSPPNDFADESHGACRCFPDLPWWSSPSVVLVILHRTPWLSFPVTQS